MKQKSEYGYNPDKKKKKGFDRVEQTKPSPAFSGGSHHVTAGSKHVGIVKPKLAAKLRTIEHKRKKKIMEEI